MKWGVLSLGRDSELAAFWKWLGPAMLDWAGLGWADLGRARLGWAGLG